MHSDIASTHMFYSDNRFHLNQSHSSGPFQDRNAEDIQNEVDTMFRTVYKLAKSFSDQPGPQRIANNVKGRIEKFKQHMPVLNTICNPGIRERHWQKVESLSRVYLAKL